MNLRQQGALKTLQALAIFLIKEPETTGEIFDHSRPRAGASPSSLPGIFFKV